MISIALIIQTILIKFILLLIGTKDFLQHFIPLFFHHV